ncbi:MAG: HAD-IA family hydrolase [Fibrobacter sp.]|nr:HAD-IA family hydrolase [Fibrobacter sp.]
MIREYDYYLFDADGTLFDTTELICRCFMHTAKSFGKTVDEKTVRSHIGMTLKNQMNLYFGPLTDEEYEKYRILHMNYQLSIYRDYLVLCPGVKEALTALKQNGKKCAVVTSRLMDTLELYLKDTQMFDFFDIIVTPESTAKHKPEPEPALKALELLGGTNPQRAIFIGDASFDIQCGHGAGMDTVFVGWSSNDSSLFPVKPDYIINDMRLLCENV